jgi:hypothetical protein
VIDGVPENPECLIVAVPLGKDDDAIALDAIFGHGAPESGLEAVDVGKQLSGS